MPWHSLPYLFRSCAFQFLRLRVKSVFYQRTLRNPRQTTGIVLRLSTHGSTHTADHVHSRSPYSTLCLVHVVFIGECKTSIDTCKRADQIKLFTTDYPAAMRSGAVGPRGVRAAATLETSHPPWNDGRRSWEIVTRWESSRLSSPQLICRNAD